ncbi:MAG TPA: hypothetical protein VFN03_11305, partial [Trueperaceae bacterium]|nr:hypothetical protein [Trueperaceae bacterium]
GVASVSIAGVGGDLAAALDLADVEWDAIARRFGIDVSVVGGGQARFTTAPLDATLDVDMSGTAAGLGITLRGSAPNDLAFTVNGLADTGGTVDLSGRLAWDQEQKAVVTGSIGGQRVDASLTLDDALSTGRLLVDVPGARVIADLSTPSATGGATEPGSSANAANVRRDVSVTATLDGTSFGGLAGDLSAAITNEGGVTTLDSLRADTSALPGLGDALPLTLDASGVLTPAPELVGTVTAPTLGETARLHVSSEPQPGATSDGATTGTTVELSWRDLLAVFDVSTSRLHLTGEAELGDVAAPFLPDTLSGLSANVIEADLTWSPSEGFGGALDATIDAPVLDGTGIDRPVRLQASAVVPPVFAPADLAVWLDVRASSGVRLATLDVTVPADPLAASALSGGLNLDTDLADLLDLPQLDLRLTGSAAIAGTLTAPAVTGTLELAGDVTAAGEFGYEAGAASLDLNGPDLSVTADYADSAWSADATIDRLPLGAWITQVADPYVSLRARADSTGGARVTVEDLVIESNASRLTGAATIDSGLRVLLQAQVDLRDLRVAGTEFHGLLRGPVIVTAPTLDELAAANITAQVDAAGVGVAAVDASVSGSIQFGGSVSDPIVNAVLRGNGALSGGLRLDAAPGRGRLQVRSDLAFAGLDTDFDLNIDGGAAQARGQLRFGEAVLLLSDDEGVAALTGAGRLDGWSVTVAAGFAGATITGPLDRLVPGSTGAVDVSVGVTAPAGDLSAEPEPWLSGTIGDLALGGQRLGDLRLTSDALGQPITLTGETISASFAPANSDWSLSLEGQTLPGDLVVDVAGTGSGMAGTLSGSVRGSG